MPQPGRLQRCSSLHNSQPIVQIRSSLISELQYAINTARGRSRIIPLAHPQADHDDKEHKALNAFNELWRSKFAQDSLLVFSTGRSHALYTQLQVRPSLLACCGCASY